MAPLFLALLTGPATTQEVVGWGGSRFEIPAAARSEVVAISVGEQHSLALKADGSVVAWGINGQVIVPTTARSGVVAIAAGGQHDMALKRDGSVMTWGYRYDDQATVPLTARLNVVAIAAGSIHSLALRSDGRVVEWASVYGSIDEVVNAKREVPLAVQSGVIAIAAGGAHSLALKSDGSVFAWGDNKRGQINVPVTARSGVVAVAAGRDFSLALKSDGGVVEWGLADARLHVPLAARSGVVAIAAGGNHCLALKSDGSVFAWGDKANGQRNVPASARREVVAISAGGHGSLALRTIILPTHPSRKSISPALTVRGVSLALVFNHPNITGGSATPLTLKVSLSSGLGTNATFSLASTVPLRGLPAEVTIPAGQTLVEIPLSTSSVDLSQTATVTAFYGKQAAGEASMLVQPPRWTVKFAAPTLASGSTTTGTVTLSAAIDIPVTVWLSSENPAVTVPGWVRIPAGQRKASFPVTTTKTLRTLRVFVTSTIGPLSVLSKLTLKAPR